MNPRTIVAWSSLTLVCLLSPAAATAQSRDNLWFAVGWAIGSAGGSGDQLEAGTRARGKGFSLGLGWALTEQLLIGGEVNYWSHRDARLIGMSTISGAVTFYPSRRSGFFLKGGVGVSDFWVENFCTRGDDRLAGFPPLARFGDEAEHRVDNCSYLSLGRAWAWLPERATTSLSVGSSRSRRASTSGMAARANWRSLESGWQQNVVDVTIGITFR